MRNDTIYNILDTLEDLRGETDIIDRLKEAYPDVSRTFIAAVLSFERQIQQISPEKEALAVQLRGEECISNIISISDKGCQIETHIAHGGRGKETRTVQASDVARWIYE